MSGKRLGKAEREMIKRARKQNNNTGAAETQRYLTAAKQGRINSAPSREKSREVVNV